MSEIKVQESPYIEHINAVAQSATYGGAALTVVGHSMSISEWAVVVSMVVAVLGFLVQMALAARLFYKDAQERRDDRAEREAEREAAQRERAAAQHERGLVHDRALRSASSEANFSFGRTVDKPDDGGDDV